MRITQTAYDDLAAKMQADSLDIFLRNLENIDSPEKSLVYAEQLRIGADLIDWRKHWHLHGKGKRRGSVVEGLGIGIHKWGGTANSSNCLLKIHPDGGVESYCGTQDLGTGTRTICAMVLAETLGLPIEAVKVNIGSSTYPFSGASGGSTTVGPSANRIVERHRKFWRSCLSWWRRSWKCPLINWKHPTEVFPWSATAINRCRGSRPAASIGIQPLEVTSIYKRGDDSPLSSSNVAGCQMARVAVDTDTGVVKIIKMVAVQDMGLVMNRKTAESQIYGAIDHEYCCGVV